MDMQATNAYGQYSPKWQFRFSFFDRHGAPSSPAWKAAFKQLPFGEKLKLNINFFALFFGCLYFFCVGMWRKGLTLLGLGIALGVVSAFLPDAIGRGLFIAFNLLTAMTANYAYYLVKVKGDEGFNPFQGMRW